MSITTNTPESLRKKLCAKHKNLLKTYKKRRDDIERLAILEDKIDQLTHWIENQEETAGKHVTEKQDSEKELASLTESLGSFSHKQVREIEEKISEHREALSYWSKT